MREPGKRRFFSTLDFFCNLHVFSTNASSLPLNWFLSKSQFSYLHFSSVKPWKINMFFFCLCTVIFEWKFLELRLMTVWCTCYAFIKNCIFIFIGSRCESEKFRNWSPVFFIRSKRDHGWFKMEDKRKWDHIWSL